MAYTSYYINLIIIINNIILQIPQILHDFIRTII